MYSSPANYKRQSALINALSKASEQAMTVKLAWWFHNAKWALINNFGWNEKDASVFVSRYFPHKSAYRACR